jgi:hypothetical protein
MSEIDESSQSTRRDLLKRGALAGAALGFAVTGGDAVAQGEPQRNSDSHDRGDIAILRFLAAAELIEHDLWQQYAEVGENNDEFNEALEAIDDDIVEYAVDTTEDELSHHQFINAYLKSIGEHPVNLDEFRKIPSPPVEGLQQIGRLTNLRQLSVDTSYYTRYRSMGNPDFGDHFPQIATIVKQPGIPTHNGLDANTLGGIARVAAFHFASIEIGGTSLYDSFLTKVSNADVLRIVGSIYATEAIHYAIFEDSLGGVSAFHNSAGTLVVPDLTEGKLGSSHVMPKRCTFFRRSLPTCSVIRPSSTENAGAVAAARALTASNLFMGQSQKFFATLFDLAHQADAAIRGF